MNLKLLLMFNKEIKINVSKKVFRDPQDNVMLWLLVASFVLLAAVQRKEAEFVLTWPVIYS